MTNATTFENNSTTHDQIIKGPCNQTANSVNGTQNCVVNTLQTQNNHCSNNTNNNSTTVDCETITAADNNSTNNANNTKDNQVVDKNTVLKYVYKKGDKAEIPIKDKGHFKNSLRRKRSTNGIHPNSPLPSKFQKPVVINYETVHGSGEVLAPLRNNAHNILGANLADFNIETEHLNPEVKKGEHIAPNLKTDSSEVESLNEANNERGGKQNDSSGKSSSESEESGERRDYKNATPQHENENSDERGDYRNRKSSREDQDSAERGDYKASKSANNRDNSGEREDYQNRNSNRENYDSSERVEYKNRPSNLKKDNSAERGAFKNRDSSLERDESGESGAYKNKESSREHDDSNERGDYKSTESNENNSRTRSRYSQNKNSKENSESNENRKPDPNSSESKESIETDDRKNLDSSNDSSDKSNESIERSTAPQRKYSTNPKTDIKGNSPAPLRDVDLGDFNSERVRVNNDGKVEPQKDNIEYADPKTAVEILPLSTAVPGPEIKNHGILNPLPDVNTIASPAVESNGNKLIHIDDGEVRPVVEINPESDEESTKSNTSDEVESLESILGVKEPENLNDNSQNDKIVEQKEVQNEDVKQEFERIPVNYNHATKTETKDSPSTEAPKKDTEITPNDGTLDIFAPEDVKYDENLNFKFDDIAIKLPDIKLPDDILTYTRDNSPYSYNNDKKDTQPDVPSYRPSYYYDHDDKEKLRKRKNKKDDNDSNDDDEHDTGFYGYYGDSEKKQNYKNKNAEAESDEEEDEEEEDLYEKFVRERFGKQGTFEKRSEKLEAASPTNPELYKTIKTILKKTADIDEQAKKSGDPNAGYMWTLEYGEKI